jgi:hypothetical protein
MRAPVTVQRLHRINRGDREAFEVYASKLQAEISQLRAALALYKGDEVRQVRAMKRKAWFGGGNDS